MTTVVTGDEHFGDRDLGPELEQFIEYCYVRGYYMISNGDKYNNVGRMAPTMCEHDRALVQQLRKSRGNLPGNHDYLPDVILLGYHSSSFMIKDGRLITHGTGVGSPDEFWRQDGRWPRFRRRLGEGIIELGDWSERRLHKDIDNWVMRGLKRGHDVVVPRGRRIDDEAWIRYGVELLSENIRHCREVILAHTHRAMIVCGRLWYIDHALVAFEMTNYEFANGRSTLFWGDCNEATLLEEKLARLSAGQKVEWYNIAIYNCGAWVPSNETYQVAGTSTTIRRGEVGAFCVRWEDDGPSEFLRWQDGELREVV